MPIVDLPLSELKTYRPPRTAEADFDAFWERTLAEARQEPLNPHLEELDYPSRGVRVHKLTYTGWRGGRASGWYILPEGDGPFPIMVNYHGYGGWRGEVHKYLIWALQGYGVLAMDTSAQSPDSMTALHPGGLKGWMTVGVADPEAYYYRGSYVDAVRALDFLADREEVAQHRIALTGTSQGGGLTLAVAALDQRPCLAMPEVPYLCHFRRSVEMVAAGPYLEILDYLNRYPDQEVQVFRTLTYFDNLNLAERIRCPVLMTVGLQDTICPPSTIFATSHQIQSEQHLAIYPFNGHEAVEAHWPEKLSWARRYLG